MRIPMNILLCSPLWAVRDEVAQLIAFHLSNDVPDEHKWEAANPYTQAYGPGKIAFVPIQGLLSKDGPVWLGSSYDGISRAVENAAADSEVKHIVLCVDSPGGEVRGCPETAAVIAKAAKVKPVSAIVEGASASAAYWLTSQATDITVTPSGEVGSVGVKLIHADLSKKMELSGIKVTELTAGTNKADWSPFKPLSEEAATTMQTRINAVHTDFLNDISAARGERASEDIKANRFGEGKMFSAKDALGHGLVDAVLSTRDFFRSLAPVVERDSTAFPRAALYAHLEHLRRRDF